MKHYIPSLVLSALLMASPVSAQIASTTDSTAPEPVILKMADGRYYNPNSGLFGQTRNELLAALGFAVSSTEIETPPVPVIVPTIPPTLDAVTRARALLSLKIEEDRAANPKPSVLTTDTDWRPVTLAVWNKTSGQISTVNILKKGLKVKCTDAASTLCPLIRVTRSQGIDSEYALDRQGDNLVVAIKYQTLNETKQKSKTVYVPKDVVYTPYAKGLKTDEVVTNGESLLRQNLIAAQDELRQANTQSRAFAGRTVADTLDPALIETLIIIEHVDRTQAVSDPDFALATFKVIIAANGDDAFAFSRSPAGALGLPQFMPKTYANLAKRPEYGLITNFDAAMRNQKNVFKAQALYLDSLLSELPQPVRDAYLNRTTSSREMVAAAYNTGPARIRKISNDWDALMNGGLAKQLTTLTAEHDRVWNELLAAKDKALNSSDQATRDLWQAKRLKLRAQHTAVENKLAKLPKSGLKQETLDYLTKFKTFYPLMVQKQNQTALAVQ